MKNVQRDIATLAFDFAFVAPVCLRSDFAAPKTELQDSFDNNLTLRLYAALLSILP